MIDMKKLLSIVVLGLLLSGNAYAEIYEMNKCYWKEFKSFEVQPGGYVSKQDINSPYVKYPEKVSMYKVGQMLQEKEDDVFTVNTDSGLITNTKIYTDEFRKYRDSVSAAWGYNEKYPKISSRNFIITNYTAGYIVGEDRRRDHVYTIEVDLKNGAAYLSGNLSGFKELMITFICESSYSNSSDNEKENSTSSGTAFFINNRGHLLTNNHVVEGCSLSKITYKNKDYDTKLIATDKTLDLALLKAEVRPKSFFNFSKDDVKKLNKVYVAGYPLGKGLSDDLKISSGIVSSLKGFEDNSNEIQIDAPINPGNSGGPIINENGDLIAIAVSGMSKDQTEGINFGIKSSAAETFLRSNKINPKKSMYAGIKDNDKLLEILEEGTVYTYCN